MASDAGLGGISLGVPWCVELTRYDLPHEEMAKRSRKRTVMAATPLLLAVVLGACGPSSRAPVEPATLPSTPPPPRSASQSRAKSPPPASDPLVACTSGDAHFADERRAAKSLTEEQQRAITDAFDFMRVHRDAPEREVRAQLAEKAFLRARTLFEANHFGEAAVAFRAIAVDHADIDTGLHASQLFLESLNVLGSNAEPARTTCYDVMARDVPVLIGLYCDDRSRPVGSERSSTCALLRKIQRDLDRLEAQKLVQRADKVLGGDTALYEQGGDAYLLLAQHCITDARAAHVAPTADRCDELAYNAGRAFMAAKKPDRARDAARFMVEPTNGLAGSPLTAKLVKLVREL